MCACTLHQAAGAKSCEAALAPIQGVGVYPVLVDGALACAQAIAEGGVLARGFLAPIGVDPPQGVG
jgi:hypothetical protein